MLNLDLVAQTLERLPKGVFLTAGQEKPNTMTMGWGSIGVYWGKPIFIAPVRTFRYTHELIEQYGEFTVSVPISSDLKTALSYCGSHSGRDIDKFAATGLALHKAKKIDTPIIANCDIHFECRVIYQQLMNVDSDSEIADKFYSDYNFHTMYYGEILACY